MSAPTLFDDPTAEGQRPPVGEYTLIEKPKRSPFLPELAARALCNLSDEWEMHTVESIFADESNRMTSPLIGTRVHLNVPAISRTGKKKWPPKKTDRVLIVTEAQEQEAAEKWERGHNACHRCGGDGLVFNGWNRDKGTKYRTCDRCDGTGKPTP